MTPTTEAVNEVKYVPITLEDILGNDWKTRVFPVIDWHNYPIKHLKE